MATILSIEAIDEQTIPILTEDYVLEIDIGGAPTRAYVDGDMEGFYHEWDPKNSKIRIKAIKVTRLISGAIWNVRLVKGTQTFNSQITYNVVPSAPVISDPGPQKLYRGGSFGLDIAIANRPTLARGNSLLTGLKYQARADGVDGINLAGQLPAAANLTETTFNANIYTENDGGQDNLSVPVTIETHTGVYVFDGVKDDLLKIGPDAATRHWTYDAPYPGHVRTGQRYDPIVASPDGIYLFSDRNDDLLKVSPDGALLWTFEAETRSYEEMVVTESGVYVYWPGSIYKVHLVTGELIWERDISYNFSNYRVYAGDVYFLNTRTNILTKLNGADGTVAWTYSAPSGYSLRGVTDDGVYIRTSRTIIKVDIETGMLAWMQTFSGRSINISTHNNLLILSIATRSNQGFPIGPYNILRINPSNGATLWTQQHEIGQSRFLDSDGFFPYEIFTTRRRVMKVNLSDGTQDWLVTLPDQSRAPIVQPKGIYILNNHTNGLIKLNKSDGSTDWSLTVNKLRFSRILFEDGSDIYAIASFGSGSDLVKLKVSDGSEQWRYASRTADYKSLAIPDFSLGV
ncbi:PQQ-binding-like beta-propeller repeat protein [Candidatus Poribacteria bacterium]|nr:PQQ-binding-like beta-propeller repeat protein [Candidatus Poribacteria bacterium]MYH79542.1 PQQ-binding-like beta-propeller repeat protein [Candidatus Poribacteria bacterium]MYK94577.1 PQQ-binding-like beta-propeller repeat protein [Candidatus Poribacteria bacterium]